MTARVPGDDDTDGSRPEAVGRPMNRRLLETSAVILVTIVTAVLVTAIPVIAGTLLPYVVFSMNSMLAILRIEAVLMLFFVLAVLLGQYAATDDD